MFDSAQNFSSHQSAVGWYEYLLVSSLGVCLGAALMAGALSVQASLALQPESTQTASVSLSLERSAPQILRIPEIDLQAEFSGALGLNDDRSVMVPDSYDTVGWYQYGPTPGELGPAVVLGHLDSYTGPAVFYPLQELEVGDEIYVDRSDGTTAVFTVESLENYVEAGFPTELVYRDLDHAALRLITCSGTYDHETLTYSHNLVVFARLVRVT